MNNSFKRFFISFCLIAAVATNFLCIYTSYWVHGVKHYKRNATKRFVFLKRTEYFNNSHDENGNQAISQNLTTVTYKDLISSTALPTIKAKPQCGVPDKLVGDLKIDLNETKEVFLTLNKSSDIGLLSEEPVFEPKSCTPTSSVAIIVPFRDRQSHLEHLLAILHPVLQRQLLRYQIFVIEQDGNETFNKGRLMNTGFVYARNKFGIHFDCFIFHDVDMLPMNDRNLYRCNKGTNEVQHLSCSVNKFDFKPLCCGMTVGGVLSFSEEQFLKANGFPNNYWGWGGEDDDMNTRIKTNGMKVVRPEFSLCRYFMINHDRDESNPYKEDEVNDRVSEAAKHSSENGLSNLETYIKEVTMHRLYVKVLVDVSLPTLSTATIT